MTNSQDPASKNACFSSVIRRLLCAGGLPTHPSSDTDNPNKENYLLLPPPPSPTPTPAGIVARLMGIDSFPNSPKVSFMRKSRSVASLDFLPNFPHHPPRRLTTSLSFRPTTIFLHDHTGDQSDMGLTPIQQKSNNLRGRVHNNSHNKKRNTNALKGKSQSQSQSQSYERVKVLKNEQEIQAALKIRRKSRVNGAKKKLVDDGFPDERLYKSRDTRYNHPLPKKVKHKKKKKSTLKRRESREYSQEYCMKALVEVCSLTMAEIEGGVWVDTKVAGVNNIQEISYQIAQHILYVLVYDMVDELIM